MAPGNVKVGLYDFMDYLRRHYGGSRPCAFYLSVLFPYYFTKKRLVFSFSTTIMMFMMKAGLEREKVAVYKMTVTAPVSAARKQRAL